MLQLKGLANEATGSLKVMLGKTFRNARLEARGVAQKNLGKMQKAGTEAREALLSKLNKSA